MSSLNRRRSFVVAVTAASVFAAAVTIRLAAGWSANTAPLTEQPPNAEELVAALRDEEARADALAAELEQVATQADELQAALVAAQDKAGQDAAIASDLAQQLASAKARLANLQAQLAAAASSSATVTVTEQAPAAPSNGFDDDHEDEPDEDGT